jgi:hypothetical protein
LCAVVIACAGCDNRTTGTAQEDRYTVQCDLAAPSVDIRHVASTARSAGIELRASDVRYDAVAHQLRALITIHNGRSDMFLGPRGVEVFGFDPSQAWPANLACTPPVPGDVPTQCIFWHFESYGDHMLAAGETSEPVEWILDAPAGAAFEFQARLWWPHGAP